MPSRRAFLEITGLALASLAVIGEGVYLYQDSQKIIIRRERVGHNYIFTFPDKQIVAQNHKFKVTIEYSGRSGKDIYVKNYQKLDRISCWTGQDNDIQIVKIEVINKSGRVEKEVRFKVKDL